MTQAEKQNLILQQSKVNLRNFLNPKFRGVEDDLKDLKSTFNTNPEYFLKYNMEKCLVLEWKKVCLNNILNIIDREKTIEGLKESINNYRERMKDELMEMQPESRVTDVIIQNSKRIFLLKEAKGIFHQDSFTKKSLRIIYDVEQDIRENDKKLLSNFINQKVEEVKCISPVIMSDSDQVAFTENKNYTFVGWSQAFNKDTAVIINNFNIEHRFIDVKSFDKFMVVK